MPEALCVVKKKKKKKKKNPAGSFNSITSFSDMKWKCEVITLQLGGAVAYQAA